jgi:hypothetical protein
MAASQTNTISTICDNSQLISDASDSKKVKSTFLYLLEDNLFLGGWLGVSTEDGLRHAVKRPNLVTPIFA